MTDAIHVEGLVKTYPQGKGQPPLTAVDGIDFQVVESLPAPLQVIARLLPLTYSVEALRISMSGGD